MIILKGSPKGISVSVDDTDFETGRKDLANKLSASKEFFKEISLEVFLTSNSLTEAEVWELQPVVREVLSETEIIFLDHEPKMIPKKHSPLDELGNDEGVTKFVRKTVLAGEVVEYENTLVVIGDVEGGAKVVAGGNVFIMGALYGSVHAGATGKQDAVVVAMKLMPERLSIGELTTFVKPNAIKRFFSNVPEIAYVAENTIKIEQYT